MRLLIVWYQSWPSMQAARPLGERGKRPQSPSLQSAPRQHGYPKAGSFPGWADPAPQCLFVCPVLQPLNSLVASAELTPAFQCPSCIREPQTRYSAPGVVSQAQKRGKWSLPSLLARILLMQLRVLLVYISVRAHGVQQDLPGPFLHSLLSRQLAPAHTGAWGYSVPGTGLCLCLDHHGIAVSPFLQPLQDPTFAISCKLAGGTLSLVWITAEDTKQCWLQDPYPGDATRNWPPAGPCDTDHQALSLATS